MYHRIRRASLLVSTLEQIETLPLTTLTECVPDIAFCDAYKANGEKCINKAVCTNRCKVHKDPNWVQPICFGTDKNNKRCVNKALSGCYGCCKKHAPEFDIISYR